MRCLCFCCSYFCIVFCDALFSRSSISLIFLRMPESMLQKGLYPQLGKKYVFASSIQFASINLLNLDFFILCSILFCNRSLSNSSVVQWILSFCLHMLSFVAELDSMWFSFSQISQLQPIALYYTAFKTCWLTNVQKKLGTPITL